MWEGARYIYRKQFESALVSNGFSVANARRDERDECQSHPGGGIMNSICCSWRN